MANVEDARFLQLCAMVKVLPRYATLEAQRGLVVVVFRVLRAFSKLKDAKAKQALVELKASLMVRLVEAWGVDNNRSSALGAPHRA